MKAIIQRVSQAKVEVEKAIVGQIDEGLLVFLGVEKRDNSDSVQKMAHKLLHYRVFDDDQGRMNLNVQQVHGGLLVISQFTLVADTSRGLRPGFSQGADPEYGESLYRKLVVQLQDQYSSIETGRYGADMQVTLTNNGPATFLLET